MLQHINTSKTFHCSLCETLINIYKTDSKGEEETLTIGYKKVQNLKSFDESKYLEQKKT